MSMSITNALKKCNQIDKFHFKYIKKKNYDIKKTINFQENFKTILFEISKISLER